MKKNKYDKRDSEIRSLRRRQDEIFDAQRRDCWVELEEPEKHGWYVVACLRKDISNRADSDTIEEALSLVGGNCWTRDKKTGYRWKGHSCTVTGKRDWQEYTPWKGSYHDHYYGISYAKWETLRPEVRRWFTPPTHLDWWGRGYCYCNIPIWFWDVKFERCWATHYQAIDTELQSEDAWIDNRLDGEYYDDSRESEWRTYPQRNPYTGKQRAHHKQTLNKIKQYDWDDSVAEFNNKVDNKWDWD